MSAILRIFSDNQFRDLAVVEEGAELTLGRSLEVDISVSEDPKISSSHLKIRAAGGAFEIEDLGSTNGTFLNDQPVTKSPIHLGEMFRCGGTEFVIVAPAKTHAHATVSDPVTLAVVAASQPEFCQATASEILERFEIANEFPIPPVPEESPGEFALRLANSGEPNFCLMFLSYALEKRAAVWWLTRCIQEVECLLDDNDREMIRLAEEWVTKPDDQHRRKAMKHAEMMEMSTPACWAGVGAFWSGGSMAPPDAPVVEPKDNLAGKAISGGAIMASLFHSPEKALDKQKAFTQLGVDIANGKIPWK